jgi:ferric-dicitrate binding protein FerR (iron transport regulator)
MFSHALQSNRRIMTAPVGAGLMSGAFMRINTWLPLALWAVCAAALQLVPGVASAQSGGCTMERAGGTSRQIMRCADGVTVTAEDGARFNLIDRNQDGRPDAVSLRDKALLIDVDTARRAQGFQVLTPQAIAAVRGTRWAVDVKKGTTAVFVIRGRVAVGRVGSQQTVVLSVGEGVDVVAGSGPLTVRRWPPARAAALLARLGQ